MFARERFAGAPRRSILGMNRNLAFPSTDTLDDLVTRARAGESDAWQEIMSRFEGLVRATAHRYRLPATEVDDVTQTVWLRLVENIDRLREPQALPGWVATTAARESGRMLTKARRSVSVDPTDQAEIDRPDVAVLATDDPSDHLIREEARDAVRSGLEQLPEQSRLLLRLLSQDPSPSYAEISDRLGMPVGSIGPTRARCLRKLSETATVRPLVELVA